MATSVSLLFLAMMLLGGGGNELLDLVSTDAYWQLKNVDITDQSLIQELENAPDADAADAPKAAAIRHLMVIRTLGERKVQAAGEALATLAEDDDPFIAAAAARAVSQIEGRDYEPSATDEDALKRDLAMLPATMPLVGHMRIPARSNANSADQVLGKLAPMMGGEAQAITGQVTAQVLQIAEKVGNVRVDAVTFGVDFNAMEQGYVVAVVHGQMDSQAVAGELEKETGPPLTIGGASAYKPDSSVGLMLPSDNRLLFVAADRAERLPLTDVAKLMANTPDAFKPSEQLEPLLDQIDRSKMIWAAGLMPPPLAHEQIVGAFRAFTAEADLSDTHVLSAKVVGVSDDANVAASAIDAFNAAIAGALMQVQQARVTMGQQADAVKQHGVERQHAQLQAALDSMDLIISVLKGLETKVDDTDAVLTASVELKPDQLMSLPLLMGFGTRMVPVEHHRPEAMPMRR